MAAAYGWTGPIVDSLLAGEISSCFRRYSSSSRRLASISSSSSSHKRAMAAARSPARLGCSEASFTGSIAALVRRRGQSSTMRRATSEPRGVSARVQTHSKPVIAACESEKSPRRAIPSSLFSASMTTATLGWWVSAFSARSASSRSISAIMVFSCTRRQRSTRQKLRAILRTSASSKGPAGSQRLSSAASKASSWLASSPSASRISRGAELQIPCFRLLSRARVLPGEVEGPLDWRALV